MLSKRLLNRMNRWGKNITHPVEKTLANYAAAKLSKKNIIAILEFKPVMLKGKKTINQRARNLAAKNNNVRSALVKYGYVNRPLQKRKRNNNK